MTNRASLKPINKMFSLQGNVISVRMLKHIIGLQMTGVWDDSMVFYFLVLC